jgi:2-polyprenyl-6-methoxyphenol hydroxylase-like FAD-dependent oxidoreductase
VRHFACARPATSDHRQRLTKDMPIRSALICGAGIAGPTLAYWLAEYGLEPTLIERSSSLRAGGYIIDFWGLGYDVAERMGLLPALRSDGYSVDEVRFVDAHGRQVGGFSVDVFRRLTRGRYISLPRGDLAKLIHRRIEGRCDVIVGDSIVGIEQGRDGVRVRFERNAERRFDLLIGADGLHSTVRSLAFGPQDRFERYLGYAVAAFETEGYRPRDENIYVSYALPGKQAARFALRGDRTMVLLVLAASSDRLPAAGDTRAQRTFLHDAFESAGWECPQILAALDRCEELYFDRVSQIRMSSWSRGRVALVGDAAFCPSLLAGQGSALAMAAAYVLAGELARDGRCERAFARYEQRLDSFIATKQDTAERFAGSFAPRSRLGLLLRNRVTSLFRIPAVANFVIGRSLLDHLALPDYPMSRTDRATG